MIWLSGLLISVVLVELFLALPLKPRVATITRSTRKAAWVMSARRVSESKKEKAMQAFTCRVFQATLGLAVLFSVAGLVLWGLVEGIELIGPGLGDFLLSVQGILYTMFISLVWLGIRIRIVSHGI